MTVIPQITPEQARHTLYEGMLAYYVPLVTGGKVTVRIREIDLVERHCLLEVTATKNNLYPRGDMLHQIPFHRVFSRKVTARYWWKPRFSYRWLDYPTDKEIESERFKSLIHLVRD